MSALFAFIQVYGTRAEVKAAARALAHGRRGTVTSIHAVVAARVGAR